MVNHQHTVSVVSEVQRMPCGFVQKFGSFTMRVPDQCAACRTKAINEINQEKDMLLQIDIKEALATDWKSGWQQLGETESPAAPHAP